MLTKLHGQAASATQHISSKLAANIRMHVVLGL